MCPINSASDIFSTFEPDPQISSKLKLEDFWNLETIGIKEPFRETDDDLALQRFNESVRFENNRYQVTWPWKEEDPNLPDNFELALGRLKSLIRRLQNEPENLKRYDAVIQEQLKRRIIEKVDHRTTEGKLKHYIPLIITPQKTTTKIRIVYDDGSAKTKRENKSLNECLLRGPVILEDLCGLLLRFRTHKIGLASDIEKAFLQVGLQEMERDVTRFLWLKDLNIPQTENNLQILRSTRVPFGVISSPFLPKQQFFIT